VRFTFHPEAVSELIHAVEYYQARAKNLGLEFLDEVIFAVFRILEFPDASARFSQNSRRCLINRFPFAIIYQIRKNEIFFVADTHLSMKPGYWKERIS